MNNMRNKILSLLVLLLTAASGAWADELTVCDGTAENSHVPVYGYFGDGLMKSEFVMPAADLSAMNGKAITSMTFYAKQGTVNWGSANFQVFMTEVESTSISAYNGPSNVVYEGSLGISNYQMTVTFTTPYTYNGGNLLIGFYKPEYAGSYMASTWYGIEANGASVEGFKGSGTFDEIVANQENFLPKTTFTYEDAVPEVVVTTNAEEGETTFTEASFAMPAFDATAEYVIVRNMADRVTPQVGDGTQEQPRFRVRKKEQGEGYEPVEFTSLEQIAALISVYDAVEKKDLVPQQDFYVKFYKIDEQTLDPISADGVELDDFDFAPGLYAVKAIAQDDSEDYGGETGFSNLFQLVEKVDLTFDPAPVVNMTVTTKEGEADPVEATAEQLEVGKIEQLDPGTEVKLKAKKGYKFIKVTAKEEK